MREEENKNETQDLTQPIEKILVNRFKTREGKQGFKIRLLSTIILLILLVFYVSMGWIYTYYQDLRLIEIAAYISLFLSSCLILLSTFEMNRATNFKKWWQQLITMIIILIAFLYPVAPQLAQFDFFLKIGTNLHKIAKPWIFTTILFCIFLIYILIGILDKKIGITKAAINFLMAAILIFAYKAFTITSLSITGNQNFSALLSFNTVVWIWLMIIFEDSFAYIGGMIWGKTKLAPKISPKKTWEGAIFGFTIAFVVGLIYGLLFFFFAEPFAPFAVPINSWTNNSGVWYPILTYILLCIIFPILGVLGDLLYSWVKRTVEIKDFSKLIPGHGGVLDRLDSITFSWAFLFILVIIFAR